MRRLAVIFLLFLSSTLLAFDPVPAPVAPDGTHAQIDLPTSQHMKNTGGSDGAGLCVYTSVTMAAKWQNITDFYGFRKFAEGRPGGSYPEKLADDINTYSKRNGIKPPAYVQHTGGDETFLDLCMKTRRCAAITYAGLGDGFYDGPVAHMVDLGALDESHGAIIDNNRPGIWLWMTRKQLVNRWKGLKDDGTPALAPFRDGFDLKWRAIGGGWCFAWLAPPAPPMPPKSAAVEPTIPAAEPFWHWEREIVWGNGDDGQPYWFLYRAGELVYTIDPEGIWHSVGGTVDIADVPSPPVAEPSEDFNKGVHFHKLRPGFRYWIGDVECSRAKAYAAVADPGDLVDDSDRYHLSIIGDKSLVTSWFTGSLAKYSRRLHVQVYKAGDWPTQDRLHAPITLQEPAKIGGKVVGSSANVTVESLSHILADVFDPPVPVPPVPPAPMPKPVLPAPEPTEPTIPVTPLLGIAALILALSARRRV